jgi:hypothetical protein
MRNRTCSVGSFPHLIVYIRNHVRLTRRVQKLRENARIIAFETCYDPEID